MKQQEWEDREWRAKTVSKYRADGLLLEFVEVTSDYTFKCTLCRDVHGASEKCLWTSKAGAMRTTLEHIKEHARSKGHQEAEKRLGKKQQVCREG